MMFNNQVGSIEALYGADADTASAVKAEYLYSPYGEVMMKSGDLADKNNITYSTRYQEANTGLLSYTYRHYSPRLKKWLSKDPISEQGGINLYQMVGNEPIGSWDILGYLFTPYMKPSLPKDHSNYNAIELGLKGLHNWIGKDKEDIIFSLDEVLKDIPTWKKWINAEHNKISNTACKKKSSLSNHETSKSFYTNRLKYILGGITLKAKISVNYNSADCSWSIRSILNANNDVYDFHPGERSLFAETITRGAYAYKWIADHVSSNPIPSDYVIPIIGKKILEDKGNCKSK